MFKYIKRRNGKEYALIKKEDTQAAFSLITQRQLKTGLFHNVTTKPYRGKKWNPDKFVWVVIG